MQNFDATNIPPQQSSGKHPEGNFPFQISNTRVKPTKAGDGGIFEVTFTSPAGQIISNYNLFNKNAQAVEIAQKELSALCHATGVFKLSMSDGNMDMCGHELRGARGTMLVGPQTSNPEYNEVKKVFDVNGNEPGKAPGSAPQPQAPQAWGGGQQSQQTQQPNPPPNGQWGGTQQTQPQAQPPQGWQPGNAQPGQAPPWAK